MSGRKQALSKGPAGGPSAAAGTRKQGAKAPQHREAEEPTSPDESFVNVTNTGEEPVSMEATTSYLAAAAMLPRILATGLYDPRVDLGRTIGPGGTMSGSSLFRETAHEAFRPLERAQPSDSRFESPRGAAIGGRPNSDRGRSGQSAERVVERLVEPSYQRPAERPTGTLAGLSLLRPTQEEAVPAFLRGTPADPTWIRPGVTETSAPAVTGFADKGKNKAPAPPSRQQSPAQPASNAQRREREDLLAAIERENETGREINKNLRKIMVAVNKMAKQSQRRSDNIQSLRKEYLENIREESRGEESSGEEEAQQDFERTRRETNERVREYGGATCRAESRVYEDNAGIRGRREPHEGEDCQEERRQATRPHDEEEREVTTKRPHRALRDYRGSQFASRRSPLLMDTDRRRRNSSVREGPEVQRISRFYRDDHIKDMIKSAFVTKAAARERVELTPLRKMG
ncbi:hypothetical protein FRC15_002328 [Serendipita sp. 397]|nr:hypothetical protein FRC15_002328 [Serendipita sp. 397]